MYEEAFDNFFVRAELWVPVSCKDLLNDCFLLYRYIKKGEKNGYPLFFAENCTGKFKFVVRLTDFCA